MPRFYSYRQMVSSVSSDISRRIDLLLEQHQDASALAVLDELLVLQPDNAWARRKAGEICARLGEKDKSREYYQAVLELLPSDPEANHALGKLYFDSGQYGQAAVHLEKALSDDNPDFQVYRLLTMAGLICNQCTEVNPRSLQMVTLWPGNPEANLLHGQVLSALNRNSEAAGFFSKVIELAPESYQGYYCLARAYAKSCQDSMAVASYKNAIRLAPDNDSLRAEFANFLFGQGDTPGAVGIYERLVARQPGNPGFNAGLGYVLSATNRLDEAEACLRKALELQPHQAATLNLLANVLKVQGRTREAESCYREALKASPNDNVIHSNRLLNLNYLPDISNQELFDEHVKWACHAITGIASRTDHVNDTSPKRKLRIGYVSADFRNHAAYYVIEPILRNHDHDRHEVVCYYNHTLHDSITRRFIEYSDAWRDIRDMTDDEVCRQIIGDGIDILVDLSGHTSGNRLPVFLRKPAPIQLSYEVYPCTTGTDRLDYKLTDHVLDTDADQRFHTEKLYWMDGCFICYQPDARAPEITEAPFVANGHVTFGSFSNLFKINDAVMDAWCAILERVPDSRMLFFRVTLNSVLEDRYRSMFTERGVHGSRIHFLHDIPDRYRKYPVGVGHLGIIAEADIILDTFPYCNHTITLEALWMGVPVVTLYGNRHASRVSASILKAINHVELIADSLENYIEAGCRLAADHEYLANIRHALRKAMQQSSLMDYPAFARRLESAYRSMWVDWCKGAGR